MAASTDPIYCRQPDNQIGAAVIGPSANTSLDGTGANTYQVFQADTTEGGFIESLTLKPVGSPAATVMRVYLCTNNSGAFTGGTTNTGSNTSLIDEITLAAWTLIQTQASSTVAVALNRRLAPGQRILVSFGTSTGAAGNGYAVTGWGGKY